MKGLSETVKTVTRLIFGPVMLFGFYLSSHNDVSHGAGFAGGVIIALGFMMLFTAFGLDRAKKARYGHVVSAVKDTVFIVFCALSLAAVTAGRALRDDPGAAPVFQGLSVLLNIFLCLAAAFILLSVFLSFMSHGNERGEKEDR